MKMLAPLAFLVASTPAFADVLVVDVSGGGDFVVLQEAIDAAQEGDTLLVREGSYGPAVVDGKGLALVADSHATVSVFGGLLVKGTALGQTVVVAGIRVRGADEGDLQYDALLVTDCDGCVRISNVLALGGNAFDGASAPGGDALHVERSARVTVVATKLLGGAGQTTLNGGDSSRGGEGLELIDAEVVLEQCTVRGGAGGPGDAFGSGDLAGPGGDAVVVAQSDLIASGSTCTGGDGASDGFLDCRPGGAALVVDGASAVATLLDVTLVGGAGGQSSNCSGADGPPSLTGNGGTVVPVSGVAREMLGRHVAREGEVVLLELLGVPGDRVWLMASTRADFEHVPAFVLPRTLAFPAYATEFVTILPPSGRAVRGVVVPELGAGVEARVLCLQARFTDAVGDGWLSGPETVVLLDSAF